VVREACRQNVEWQAAGLPAVPVAVNVSARQFAGEGIAKVVERALLETNLEPSLLELELTETALFHDTEMNDHTLRSLRTLGVRLSIDDFGTGYSGLHYLAQMPINCLKIDRAFVSQIGRTGADAPIIEAIIALAHSLHISVVAEGVETTMQAEFLRERGCEQMQGFLFCPPIPAARMEDLITLQRCAVADEVHYLLDPSHRGLSRYEATGADPLSAPADVTALLFAVNHAPTNGHTEDVDMGAAARVLDALRIEERRTFVPPKLRSVSLRVAAGTFVGMVPISSGMAAAGVLPTPLQSAAAVVLAPVGVEVPELPVYAAQALVEVQAEPLDHTSTT
jgi:EAL domain-containing protein (putative c-di-GMP-specific phosphodiesterase class I)